MRICRWNFSGSHTMLMTDQSAGGRQAPLRPGKSLSTDAQARAMGDFGRHVGMAYQIVDNLLGHGISPWFPHGKGEFRLTGE